jgi:hypothetical protein
MKFVAVINNQNESFKQDENQGQFVMKEPMHNLPINKSNFDIREKDEQFYHLQQLIDAKKKMLLEKQKTLKRISNQNEFLENVKNDYSKYNHYILKQKNGQIRALEMLNEYIQDLSHSGELSEQNIKDSKHEQRKIMKELNQIRNSLNILIDEDEPSTL